jgi:uncharacterized Zn finger protein
MTSEGTNMKGNLRCRRCRARSTVQSIIELRPGVEYLTLRCISCGLVFDAQAGVEKPGSATPADADRGPNSPK